MKKRIISICIVFIIAVCPVISVPCNSYATEEGTKDNCTEEESYLLERGCPAEVIETFDKTEINHLVENLKKGEASLSWSYGEIDNLEVIQHIVNSSDDELKQDGFSASEIQIYREQIEELNNKSDAELIEELGIEESAVKSIREAFKPNKDFKRKAIEENNVATLSGTLTSSEFYHSLYADRYSDSVNERKYRIRVGFNWLKAFISPFFDDDIAVAWGGNFAISEGTIASQADYYLTLSNDLTGLPYYETCASRRSFVKKSVTPNVGIIFSTPQRTSGFALKTGYIRFYIYKKKAEGQVANVTSQYLHRTVGVSSFSISSTGSISVSAGAACSVSDCNIVSVNY